MPSPDGNSNSSGNGGGNDEPIVPIIEESCPGGYVLDGLGGCVKEDDCETSKADLKKVFPKATDLTLTKLAGILNKFGQDFGIDNKEKLQHFLAQAGHETGEFNKIGSTESLYYTTKARLIKIFGKYF